MNKNKKNKRADKKQIGGMALFDGLVLHSDTTEAIANVYKDEVIITKTKYTKNDKKFSIKNIPLLRGIFAIEDLLKSSIPYILKSAEKSLNNIFKEEDLKLGRFEIISSLVIAIFLILLLFTLIPNLISMPFYKEIRNIIQCVVQIIIVLIYLRMMKKTKALNEVFEYHGAEHKVVNAYETLPIEQITVENVKKVTRFQKRCGGNFLSYLFVLTILATILIPSYNLFFKSLVLICLFPILVGLSYEILFITAKYDWLDFISKKAMLIQHITTKEPSDKKIEVAIYALFSCLNLDKDINIYDYIKKVKEKYENVDYNDIKKVIAYVLKKDLNDILINSKEYMLNYNTQIKLNTIIKKMYKEDYPVEYLLNRSYFYKEEYFVNENVLIPRNDTEILVDKAIEYISKYNLKNMLDMCSGSGCIGISVSKNSDIEKVTLVDVSKEAINISKKNAKINNVETKINYINSNLFEKVSKENKFDIIVSNPPYIKTNKLKDLDKSVKYEPKIALDGGVDGLKFYKKILNQSKNYLNNNGYIMFEIGFDELEDIKNIIAKDKSFLLLECIKDYGGNDRVVICRFQTI